MVKFERDHAVRIAVSHLQGMEREAQVMRLLTHPHELERSARERFSARLSKRPVSFAVRLTAEEYLGLRSRAKVYGLSMSQFVRRKIKE